MPFSELIGRSRAYLQAISRITNQIAVFDFPLLQNIIHKVADLNYPSHRSASRAAAMLDVERVRTSRIVAANAAHRSIGSLCSAAI